jgi:murein DD-endopeptidase MepM/ murein hydrolase activator NlpD
LYWEHIDISCAYGTKIYASASGTVEYASNAIGYGKEVSIDHQNGIETIYGHNSKILVHVGQTVNKGDLIALSGSTGSSTGPHLHFEIRKNRKAIDPIKFYKEGVEKNGF